MYHSLFTSLAEYSVALDLISTLLSLSTIRVSFSTLRLSLQQVSIYVMKFRNRLSAQHLLHLQRLTAFLDSLQKYLAEWKVNFKGKGSERSEVISASELVERLGKKAKGINMLAVEKYLKSSKVRVVLSFSSACPDYKAV